MESVLFNISQVLGITIIHSIWQGLLIYFVLRIVLALSVKMPASGKYLCALLSMLAITGWFVYTLVNEIAIYNWVILKPGKLTDLPLMLEIPAGIKQFNIEATRYYYNIARYLPYITAIYGIGFLFNSARLLTARKKINTIKRTMLADSFLQVKVNDFASSLNITKNVKAGLSKLVDVPCITGFLKPVILLPVTLSTTLSDEEIEAIILHELAHVKRNDYLINLIQQSALVLLFFNPFAQMISRIINRERENSCDDIVVSVSGKPLVYAQALMKLALSGQSSEPLALAANGKKHDLLNRIQRIMKPANPIGNSRQVLLTVALFAIGILGFAWLNPTLANGEISVRNVKPAMKKVLAMIEPSTTAVEKPDTSSKKTKAEKNKTAPPLADADNNNMDSPNNYQLFGFGDPKIDSLNAQLRKYSKAVQDYYNNDIYKTLMANAHGYSRPQRTVYDDDTVKHLMAVIDQSTAYFKSHLGNDTVKERDTLGKNIGIYYNSDQFKKLNVRLQTKYHIDPDRKYDGGDAEYQKYRAALSKNMPAGILVQIAQLKTLSGQLHNELHSSEYQATMKQFKSSLDSLKAYYKRPSRLGESHTDIKKDIPQEEVKKYQEHYQAYINNPEIKHDQEMVQEYAKQLSEYYNSSPQSKQHEQQWKNELRTMLGDDYDKIVHPEHIGQ